MMIKCLGGFREVGRNAVLLETRREKLVFDYGLKVETAELPGPAKGVDAVLLGHAHLDHCGSVPALFKRDNPHVYSTISTFDQTHLLLKDSLKVARLRQKPQHFTIRHIEKMKQNEVDITYGQQFETKNCVIDVFDAGHIPGSVIFVVETEGKKILYTGDFKLKPTKLLAGAKIDIKDIDVVVMETTYSSREHPPRQETEKKLIDIVKETIDNNGIAIIPAFAVGRAAEVLMVLDSFKHDFPIYLDGMAREATEIALKYPEFLRNPKALKMALKDVIPLYRNEKRKKAIQEPCAIVTTGGCLDGGPVVNYIKSLYTKPECSLILTGFMIPRTAGRYLQDTGRFVAEGIDLKVKMNMHYLDFSAHAGRSELFEFVRKINPKQVICIHGDYCERFATELKGRGVEAIAPKNGDMIKI